MAIWLFGFNTTINIDEKFRFKLCKNASPAFPLAQGERTDGAELHLVRSLDQSLLLGKGSVCLRPRLLLCTRISKTGSCPDASVKPRVLVKRRRDEASPAGRSCCYQLEGMKTTPKFRLRVRKDLVVSLPAGPTPYVYGWFSSKK